MYPVSQADGDHKGRRLCYSQVGTQRDLTIESRINDKRHPPRLQALCNVLERSQRETLDG